MNHRDEPDLQLEVVEPEKTDHEKLMEAYARLDQKLLEALARISRKRAQNM